jgi:hypothetical protein
MGQYSEAEKERELKEMEQRQAPVNTTNEQAATSMPQVPVLGLASREL